MPRRLQLPTGDAPARTHMALPADVRRMALLRVDETQETLTGYIARLIREDWKRQKGSDRALERLTPPPRRFGPEPEREPPSR